MSTSEFIDLRSDTVTRPTAEMRRAMAEAEVGDDVYGEDPTINRLERRAAEILGKEAGMFVPTGTMGNTIGVKLHTQHGQEVICEARSHVYGIELAMMAWFSGCLARPILAEDGILRWDQIRKEIRPLSPNRAPTGVIELENTHNMAGGAVMPVEVTNEICNGAHELGLKVHLDGARIFNAAACLGRNVKELAAGADTVMFCLSKGLCAAGRFHAGGHCGGDRPRASLSQAARRRDAASRHPGGSRTDRPRGNAQAARGGPPQRPIPGRRARPHPGIRVTHRVETNIVIFDVSGMGLAPAEVSLRLKQRGVLINGIDAPPHAPAHPPRRRSSGLRTRAGGD